MGPRRQVHSTMALRANPISPSPLEFRVMSTSRASALAAVALSAVLTASGCGSTSGAPDPTTPGTASDPSDPSASDEATSDTPSIPADWKTVKVDVAEMRVPPTWGVRAMGTDVYTVSAPKSKVGISPGFGNFGSDAYMGDGEVEAMVDDVADRQANQMKNVLNLDRVQRLEDTTINGSRFYHFRAESEFEWIDKYGTVTPDGRHQVSVAWSFNKSDIDRKKAETLINEVMPTLRLP